MPNLFRYRCNCGNVFNAPYELTNCEKCGAPFDKNRYGVLQLYRMGHMLGAAAGMGIYIDNVPFGHVGCTETVKVLVPFGEHKLHLTLGMSRKCTDLNFVLTPQQPIFYAKGRIKAGFWTNTIIIEPSKPEEMPPA